jgi:hypothetical protein
VRFGPFYAWPMTKREHPLKGEFDTAAARWERTTHEDGTPAALEIGYADNGLVALRMAEDPEGDVLIYTPSEWEAFVEGVRDGEFDIETWDDEPIVEIIDDDEDEDRDANEKADAGEEQPAS